jgi:8-oxo-dGTP pyrophosphatase MutT (NUDIX family)
MKPWVVLKSTALLKRHWMELREDLVSLSDGSEEFEFHVVELPTWVAVVALTLDRKILFVDQYRHASKLVSRELPAGVIEPEETPLAAAQRELLEETGYVAEEWQPLIELLPEPSKVKTRAHFFFARSARRVAEQRPDSTEQIHVVPVDIGAWMDEVSSGRLLHGVHLAALLFAAQRGLLA